MADCKFKVGDRVAVLDHRGAFDRIRTVLRVMTRFVELDNGSKWQRDGYAYPQNLRSVARITEVAPVHEVADEHRRLAGHLYNANWNSLTADQLRRVMAIVNEPKESP